MKKTTLGLIASLFLCASAAGQSVSGYSFSESAETYIPVDGTLSSAAGDDGSEDSIPFGFSFPFGGSFYTTFSISVNGFIRLGNPIGDTNWTNVLDAAAAQRPLIAAFWDDHNSGTGAINYALSGTAPNRIVHVGWHNINPSGGGGTSETAFGSFSMRLHETTGIIEFVYAPTITAVGTFTASIGLNDMAAYLSVTPGAAATVSSVSANNSITSSAFVVGKKYTFTPQPQCSGMPSLGNTIASSAAICADFDLVLSLQTPITAYGISYQWQSSVDGVSFTNIDAATGPTLATTQTEDTFYRCVASCGADTATSTPVLVSMSDPSGCYCEPVYEAGMTDGDLISNVAIAGTTLANNTGTAPVNPYYTYFTGQPNYTAELQVGGTYELSVTVGSYGQQHSTAWIDYNDDAVFSEEERIGFSEGEIGSFGTAQYAIQLSCDAAPGVHRLRIRDVWNTDAWTIEPCAEYGYGETEDYDITILSAEACPVPYSLNVSSVNASSGIFSWSSGCGQASWNVFVVVSGNGTPTVPTYSGVTSPFVFTGLDAETVYDIYVQGNCDANGLSDWAGPFTFTTVPMAVANDDCATAFSLQVGSVFEDYAITATNVGATKTLGEPNVTCATFGFGGDVWFSAVVPASGTLSFETQADAASALNDTGLSAYAGTCGGGLEALGCSDDEGVDGFSILHLAGLTPGATIYARVWEYANDNPGTFRVSAYDASLGAPELVSGSFRFFPNPVNDVLHLSADETITTVNLVNLLGQTLLSKAVHANTAAIDMSGLPAGNYFVKVTSGAYSKTVKVVRQ